MAVFKSLTFDGINSLNYGIYVTGEAVYNAPERAVEMVTIPGRNGALAIDQGYFENIEVSYPCGCFADTQAEFASKVSAFRNAIASRYSYKRLTDEYNADEYRLGLYKSGLEVDAVRYGTAGQFTITFDCKPQRFLLDGDAELSPTDYSDVHTVSGDIVQITNDGSLGVKSLTASLEPIQSLNGYDKPWVGGAGKNKLPVTVANIKAENTGYTWSGNATTKNGITFTIQTDNNGNVTGINANGTASADANLLVSSAIPSSITGEVILTGCPSGGSSTTYYQTIGYFGYDYGSGKTGEIGASSTRKSVIMVKSGTTVSNLLFKPMIRLATVTDDTYEPYSNICPISGHTECVTSVVGKNLLKTNDNLSWTPSLTKNADGSIKAVGSRTSNGAYAIGIVSLKANNTYVMKASGSADLYFQMLGANSSPVAVAGLNDGTYTPNSDETVTIRLFARANISFDTVIYPQIELGTTATDYEPYNGNTYTTNLGRTVYGGSLDVVSGVLTVTSVLVDMGSLNWSKNTASSIDVGYYFSAPLANAIGSDLGRILSAYPMSDKLGLTQTVQAYGSAIDHLAFVASNTNQYIIDSDYADATAFKTAMNGVQLVYELATPQTYQLTPTEVQILLGTNNVWTDCGEISVEYGIPPYYNPTEFDAKPLIKVTGRGTLGIGEYILTITGTVTQTLYIDCETMEIYTLEGTVPTGASSLVSINKTDFPVLKPGHNGVSVGSGLSGLTIVPRWWKI